MDENVIGRIRDRLQQLRKVRALAHDQRMIAAIEKVIADGEAHIAELKAQENNVQYRLDFIDRDGNFAGSSYEFEAPDDAAALRAADVWREGRRTELRSRGRLVVGT